MESSRTHNPVVHVGKVPSDTREEWVTTTVYFHGFANLPHESGSFVDSSYFNCLGHRWYLCLYPRGKVEGEVPVEEMVSLFLKDGSIEIEFALNVQGFTNNCKVERNHCFDSAYGIHGCGNPEFLTRRTALTYLVKDALVIEVRMKAVKDPSTFDPRAARIISSFKDFFMDKESADVAFDVGGKQFYAHRLILWKASPLLANLTMTSPDGKSPSHVSLSNVSVDAFEALLRYIYGINIYNVRKDIVCIKDILEVADKYGVINLKLEAEELLVSSISLDVNNVVDHYLYAESKNCALLKEKVMDFIVKNGIDICASMMVREIPNDLKDSLLNDVLTAVAIKDRKDAKTLETMPIGELCQKAHERGLDVDSSREALIALLK